MKNEKKRNNGNNEKFYNSQKKAILLETILNLQKTSFNLGNHYIGD